MHIVDNRLITCLASYKGMAGCQRWRQKTFMLECPPHLPDIPG